MTRDGPPVARSGIGTERGRWSWATLRCVRGKACSLAFVSALSMAMGLAPEASADELSVEQAEGERGYLAVEELSYEAIIEPSDTFAATLRLRVALHNTSRISRDVVHIMALPFATRLRGIAAAEGGTWTTGRPTKVVHDRDRRDPGTVFVRELEPESSGDITSVEVVVFGIAPGATVQVEIEAQVYPRLRGGRWEIDLPTRGVECRVLAGDRRVLVRGKDDTEFWVDEESNKGSPFVLTRAEDTVTVAWPAQIKSRGALDGHLEVTPGPEGFDDGTFRLYLRLGPTKPVKPEHVIVLVDRSKSTGTTLRRDAMRLLDTLFAALPEQTTYEVLGFSRKIEPLLPAASGPPRVGDEKARNALAAALSAPARQQGTDLATALHHAGQRAKAAGDKRSLVLVITDGMLPTSIEPSRVSAAFDKGRGRSTPRPEVLFVVDEPMLSHEGIRIDHPVARVAAELGARISLESLAQLGAASIPDLLSAPRVLGELEVVLDDNMVLDDPLPRGLVAGGFAVLEGRYVGKPGRRAKIRGRLGSTLVHRTLVAQVQPRRPEALAVALTPDGAAQASVEGFVEPPWYRPRDRKRAQQSIAQSGRTARALKGYLDDRIFRHYLTTRVLPRARACYNQSLRRSPDQSGRIVLEMEVGKGEVMMARALDKELARSDEKLLACMTEAAWSLDVPAGKLDDRVYVLRYPLQLVPPKNGRAARIDPFSDGLLQILPAPARALLSRDR